MNKRARTNNTNKKMYTKTYQIHALHTQVHVQNQSTSRAAATAAIAQAEAEATTDKIHREQQQPRE